MQAKWSIYNNHIVLECNNRILHPSAADIYSLLKNNSMEINGMAIECNTLSDDLPDIRFSKVGTQVQAKLINTEDGHIELKVFANRKGLIIPVDIIEGTIVDHCISGNTWFYLSGNVSALQELITNAQIITSGNISFAQYLCLIENELFSSTKCIMNYVDAKKLCAPIDIKEGAPEELQATLFPYQKDGYLWLKYMLDENNGCILGDEMGLGKTMQVIAVLLKLREENKIPNLVVAPISLLANWKRECEKFAPSLKTCVHYGANRISRYKDFLVYDVIITSYTVIVSDIHMMNMLKWHTVILDEAQNIKNPFSTRTKTCKAINRIGSIAVSGTPFENHMSDIWSLIDFVKPGLLGSLQSFNNQITDDIEGGEKIEPILTQLMIRRVVADVAKDLPEKIVSAQPIQMSEYEAELYRKYLDEVKNVANANNINLGMLQKLRMFCTHPYAVQDKKSKGDPTQVSVKYQRFVEIASEIIANGEKLIVFTSYKKMFDIFALDIPLRFGVPIWMINGETPIEHRQEIVDRFNNLATSAILILNPRAAGTGLNITGANHVIHYNLEWNPSLEDQASARAYRRGQKKTVFVYRLFYADTVEQIVNERIERKRSIAGTAIIGNNGKVDREDMLAALELIPSLKIK